MKTRKSFLIFNVLVGSRLTFLNLLNVVQSNFFAFVDIFQEVILTTWTLIRLTATRAENLPASARRPTRADSTRATTSTTSQGTAAETPSRPALFAPVLILSQIITWWNHIFSYLQIWPLWNVSSIASCFK